MINSKTILKIKLMTQEIISNLEEFNDWLDTLTVMTASEANLLAKIRAKFEECGLTNNFS